MALSTYRITLRRAGTGDGFIDCGAVRVMLLPAIIDEFAGFTVLPKRVAAHGLAVIASMTRPTRSLWRTQATHGDSRCSSSQSGTSWRQ